MSERKVLNKYYPPDFDINKLPRLHLSRDRQFIIRIMAPMSIKCNGCGEYIYKGKKFNARQETVQNEDYLGLRIYRFYIKCPRCMSEITFKTDPKNTDYTMEQGGKRCFDGAKLAAKIREKELELQNLDNDKTNPMEELEKRTKDSRKEMEDLEQLEELRDLNKRHLTEADLNLNEEEIDLKKQEELDEELVSSIKKSNNIDDKNEVAKKNIVVRKRQHVFSTPAEKIPEKVLALPSSMSHLQNYCSSDEE